MAIRFVHLADCHLGSWRESKMRDLNLNSFIKVIDDILEEHIQQKISFIIIAGDLFNTSLPSVDVLKIVTEKLKELSDSGIRIYGVAGSHDYSSSGKTMLDVLEKAKIFTNVMKGTIEQDKLQLTCIHDESGVELTGISGKRGMLDSKEYKRLDYSLLEKDSSNPKIFVFHAPIEEFKPEELYNVEGIPLSSLPRNFLYYAGGHVHYRYIKKTLNGTIVFPGPTCPNNFKEWVDLEDGSYVLGTIENNKDVEVEEKKVSLHEIKHIVIDVHEKDPIDISEEIDQKLTDIENTLVLISLKGTLKSGTLIDLHFEELMKKAIDRGAYFLLRNTTQLNTPEIDLEINEIKDMNLLEQEMIDKHIEESKLVDVKRVPLSLQKQKNIINGLMHNLMTEKKDGETQTDYQDRLEKEFFNFLESEF